MKPDKTDGYPGRATNRRVYGSSFSVRTRAHDAHASRGRKARTSPDETDMFILGAMLGWAASFVLWVVTGGG